MQQTQAATAQTAICGKRHKALKHPVSVERGFGPVCWGNVQGDQHEHKKPFADPADESDYNYYIDKSAEPVLVITDLNRGRKSVTNNMKAILNQIVADEGITLTMPIVYRDSDGSYDGVNVDASGTIAFYPLVTNQRVTNKQEAIQAALRRENKKGA